MGLFGFFDEGGSAPGFVAWAILIVLALVIVPQCWGCVAFFAVVWLVGRVFRVSRR